ncbi:MAG: hypothetical protein COA75_06825 [Cellvibrionales bacterium]|nr:MAG: hypothetical protein COA75_06825 [Cellvibrionales bacterium]
MDNQNEVRYQRKKRGHIWFAPYCKTKFSVIEKAKKGVNEKGGQVFPCHTKAIMLTCSYG